MDVRSVIRRLPIWLATVPLNVTTLGKLFTHMPLSPRSIIY